MAVVRWTTRQRKRRKMTEQNKKIVIVPGAKMFLVSFAMGLLIGLVVDLPLSSWIIAGVLIVCCLGIFCFFKPYIQRFTYLLVGFSLGLVMLYVTRCFILDCSLVKLDI